MKKSYLLLITLLAFLPFGSPAQGIIPNNPEKEIMAAKQVLMRVVGTRSSSFQFEKIADEKGHDVYEVIAQSGKVLVKGSSTIAMTRGAYDYMRKACKVQFTWSSGQVLLPWPLPDYIIQRVVTPYAFRQYFNVCAFGYSTAFWQWDDWERELDWMAMHGINMPLALTGQEAIWQKVYKDMGMTDDELSAFFTGPAFLPWQRMGNLYKHDGPLPQSFIDGSRDLQKQILVRMRQLGMKPIVPAFSGIVPAAYSRINPNAKLLEMKGWCNFPDSYKSYILAPGNSDFTNIGKRFIEEYRLAYGDVDYYLADLFNENEVPVSASNRDTELAAFGKSVSDAITAGDPNGVWVMQGWLFYNNEKFWDKDAVKSFLSQVPDDKMLIIDLANESFQGWEKHEGFYGKPWIYSIIHNYGGNSQLSGNLPFYATDPPSMLANAKKGNIAGFGISPEGIENNEAVYELLTEMAWRTKEIDIKAYMGDFTLQRYGKTDNEITFAWLGLLGSVYCQNKEHPLNLYQARPPFGQNVNMHDDYGYDQAVGLFIKSIDNYKTNQLFKNDLAQVVAQFAGNKVDLLLLRAMEQYQQGLADESKHTFDRAFELMIMMDGLLWSLPDQRLESLIENARKWGKTKGESDYFEADAKRQLTQWGTNDTPVLHEYASKVWSGLMRDYYLGRWTAYAKSLRNYETVDFNDWENNWINRPGLGSKAPTTGEITKYALTLYNAALEYVLENTPQLSIKASYLGENKVSVSLLPLKNELEMKYSTDGNSPLAATSLYDKPFEVDLPATIKAVALQNNKQFGDFALREFPVSFGKPVSLLTQPAKKYIARNAASLTDGILGSVKPDDGNWLGFEGENMGALVTLDGSFKVSAVTLSYLEDGNSWIFAPHSVIVETSADGITFQSAGVLDLDDNKYSMAAVKKSLTITFPTTAASYVRLLVFNRGTCPANHVGAGKKAWLFVDEVRVE